VETIDEHSDIIQLFFKPIYLFPSWCVARDFCLLRYWRLDDDGSYIVCYDSVLHRECPPIDGHVRGELHGAYTIAPRKDGDEIAECLLTHIVQVDPRGWVPTFSPPIIGQSYADAFTVAALLQILDVRDALHQDRFVNVFSNHETTSDPLMRTFSHNELDLFGSKNNSANSLGASSIGARSASPTNIVDEDELLTSPSQSLPPNSPARSRLSFSSLPSAIATNPEPIPPKYWSEPDSDSFKVRGKDYKTDKKKINAGDSVFKLIALDVVEGHESLLGGICKLPNERVQQALKAEREGGPQAPKFIVAINIAIPGPPYFHAVFYYAVDDMSLIDGTGDDPLSPLANQFFFGDSDEFRDKTFKLIPRIVDGNFLVRKAVGSTPAIIGKKLEQSYVRDDRFFELVLDVGSSSVASGVVRLSLGYSRTLVVDMAFVLQGDEYDHLPERVFGCARVNKLDFEDPRFRFISAEECE